MKLKYIMGTAGFVLTRTVCLAQNYGISYTTEFQTNMEGQSNWVNLLRTDFEYSIAGGWGVEAATIHIYKPVKERIADDLQVFSNIEEDNLPVSFAVLGLKYEYPLFTFFAGIRNMNEDYFVSPVTSLFINSSCGIYPTISSDPDIPNYPMSSLCLHMRAGNERLNLTASVYNGMSGRGVKGGGVFNVNPVRDGVFGIMSLNSDSKYGNYVLGSTLHYGMCNTAEKGNETEIREKAEKRVREYAVWTSAEIPLINRKRKEINLMMQYSVNPMTVDGCRQYAGLGLDIKNFIGIQRDNEFGIFANYAEYACCREFASEITWKIQLNRYLYVQPAYHHIISDGNRYNVLVMRFGLSWG